MSSERESANLAFYAIVYSKGLVEKQQLQGALNRATLDGLPLETVLLEAGAIKPADCVEVLSQRAELGRACRECESITYVLPDEDPSSKKCESCGGRLRRSRKEEREARRSERKKRAASSGSGSGTSTGKRRAAGASGVSARELKALQERLEALEQQLGEQVHQAVDTRLAQEDLQGMLDRAIPQHVEQVLAQADLSGIVDRVSDEALAIVSARVDEADLSGLYDRVAEEALEKVSGRVPAVSEGGGAPVDTKALVEEATDQAVEQVMRSVRAELEALEEQAVAKASQRALSMLEEVKESSEEQAALAENSRLAVEEMLTQYDLPTLTDRISEQVLQALDAREDSGEGSAAGGGKSSSDVDERLDAIDAAMQELLDEMVELSVPTMKQELEALNQLDLPALKQQVLEGGGGGGDGEALAAELERLAQRLDQAAERPALEELQRRLEELIASPPQPEFDPNALRTELREEAVEVAVRKAVSAVQEELQQAGVQRESEGLEGISAATEQVTAQALQRLDEHLEPKSKQLAEQAMQVIQKSLSAMDMSALTNKVMNEAYAGLEERAAAMELPGGGGGAVDVEAVKAAVLPEMMRALEERLDRDLAELPDRIGQQAAAPVLQAIESRIEKLDLRNLPSKVAADAVPMITEQVLAQLGDQGGGGGASPEELERTKAGILEWVESRFAQLPPPEAVVQMAAAKAGDGLEVRLSEIETKLAELEAAALGGIGGGGGGGPSPDEVAQVVQAQVMSEVEERLAGLQGNGSSGPSPDEVAQVVQAQVMSEVEERLASFQPGNGGGGGEGGPGVAELAAQNALAAVEARLSELGSGGGGGGGGVSVEQVEEIARKAALEVGQARGASEELADMPIPSGSSVIKLPGFEKKFIALAKEVKNLRVTLTRMQQVQSESVVDSKPTGGGGGGGDLVAALNSPEFKQMFDTKINQVMSYLKSDVIPKTVKKVLDQ